MLADDPKADFKGDMVSSGTWYFCPALKRGSNLCSVFTNVFWTPIVLLVPVSAS